MTLFLRDELEAAATDASPRSDLVARSRQVGQRRLVLRRRRALVGAGAAIAAVAVGASFGPTWWTRSERSVDVAGTSPSLSPTPGPSQTAEPDAAITGTAADWLAALETSMPHGHQMEAIRASTDGPSELSKSSHVQAVFRYTSDGRTTALVVTAFAKDSQAAVRRSGWDAVLTGCGQSGVTCDPVQQTATGPVLLRHVPNKGRVDALSLRASGVVVEASSFSSDVATEAPQPGSGVPGMANSLDELVTIAALAPEPALADAGGAAAPAASSTP